MHRRSFLTRGLGALAIGGSLAGCLQGGGGGGSEVSLPGTTPDPSVSRAGLAPEPENVELSSVDPDSLEHRPTEGVDVPLLPIEHAYDWYRAQEARFVDARSLEAYEASHVAGAVLSPAPSGFETADPAEAWPKDERIVTYCTCPHHLSSLRAASLIEAGHEAVFALDEGFGEWYQRDYPIGSSNGVASIGPQRAVSGSVGAEYAGETVWLRHEPTGQREPGEIAGDGSFEVTFRFVEIGPESTLTLETPAWTRSGTLFEFTSGTVR